MNHSIARTGLAVAALAVAGLAGCGGDDDKTTTGATAAPDPGDRHGDGHGDATTTDTTPTTTTAEQREAVVPGKEETLKSGDIGLNVKVLKVVDPVAASVDRAQPGKKLVGVFVEGKTDGVVEPTKTSSLTSLQTTDGKVSRHPHHRRRRLRRRLLRQRAAARERQAGHRLHRLRDPEEGDAGVDHDRARVRRTARSRRPGSCPKAQ